MLFAESFFANENLPAILGSQGGSFVSGKGGAPEAGCTEKFASLFFSPFAGFARFF